MSRACVQLSLALDFGFQKLGANSTDLFGQSVLSFLVQFLLERNSPFESHLRLQLALLLLLP
jgi:hypothetical protein